MDLNEIISLINKIMTNKKIRAKLTDKNLESNLKTTGINSLEMMEIIVELESQLNISLPDEELLNIVTPKDLINLIINQLKNGDQKTTKKNKK